MKEVFVQQEDGFFLEINKHTRKEPQCMEEIPRSKILDMYSFLIKTKTIRKKT